MDGISFDITRCILQNFARDYEQLSLKDMEKKYLTVTDPEPVALSKMKKTDLIRECKSLGLLSTGSVIELKRILKKHRTASGVKTSRGNKKKNIKKVVPLHNHELCTEIREDCPLCQSHGNVMNLVEVEYEIVAN